MNTHQTSPPVTREERKAIFLSSISWMTVLMFFGVGLPCWYAFDLAWGAGLGAMSAMWGGPGYGVMAAMARVSLLEERRASSSVRVLEPSSTRSSGRVGLIPHAA